MKEKIVKLINDNPKVFEESFVGVCPTDEEIENAEKELGLKIPEEYIWFLKNYGYALIGSGLLGFGANRAPLFVGETLKEREYGLPKSLIVFENCDEYVHCIDTETKKIVSWSIYDSDGVIDVKIIGADGNYVPCNNFYEYFLDCIKDEIENYDEEYFA